MRLKKLVALGLAMIMGISVLTGCGSTENKESIASETKTSSSFKETNAVVSSEAEESKGIVFPLEETMSFTCLAVMPNVYSLNDNCAWQALLERANITMELTEIKSNEMKEKGGLLMNSGDYPEVLFKCGHLDLEAYGRDGLLIPLEDLIREYAPNLTAILDERNAWQDITSADGHIYTLPGIEKSTLSGGSTMCWWINEKWLDNLGLKEPTNQDELYAVLKAFKEKDANGNGDPNDEIPMTFPSHLAWNTFYMWFDGVLGLKNHFAVVDGEFVYYPMTEEYKEDYLAYMTKLFEEGLIDPLGFTQTTDQLKAVGASGDVLGMFYNSSSGYAPVEPVDYRMNYGTLNSFNEEGLALNTGVSKGGLAITDKCKNPEVIIAWADYMYSEEGGRYPRLGVEGISYEINADGTYNTLKPEGIENRSAQCTLMGGAIAPYNSPDLYYNVSPEANAFSALTQREMYGEEGVFGGENGVVMPVISLTEEEVDATSTLILDITSYIENYAAQVITGELSLESSWQEYQDNLEKMDIDKLISVYTAAYERATEK